MLRKKQETVVDTLRNEFMKKCPDQASAVPLEFQKKQTSCVTTNTLIHFAAHSGLDVMEYLEPVVLPEGPYNIAFLTDTKNWILHEYTKKMYHRLNDMLDDPEGTFNAALYSIQLKTLGIIEIAARLFAGPDIAYKKCGQISWKFNRIYKMIPEEVESDHALIRVRYFDEFEPTHAGCNYTRGILTTAPGGWGLPSAVINELQCQADGADSCLYDISFEEKRRLTNKVWYFMVDRRAAVKRAYEELEENYKEMQKQRDELARLNLDLETLVEERTSQLIQSEKRAAVYHLVAGVRHEMNTHIQTLLGYLQDIEFNCLPYADQMLENASLLVEAIKKEDDKTVRSTLQEMKGLQQEIELDLEGQSLLEHVTHSLTEATTAAEVMEGIIKKLKLTAEYTFKPKDITEIVNDTITYLSPEIRERFTSLKIRRDYQPDLPYVECDEAAILQALSAQIMNSLDAMSAKEYVMDEKPELFFSVYRKGREVEVITGDNGIGIEAADQSHIFDPFYTKRAKGQKGTGLGLHQVSTIIHDHHGAVAVESEPQKYTNIIWKIPITHKKSSQ